jgi:hypothetical protein
LTEGNSPITLVSEILTQRSFKGGHYHGWGMPGLDIEERRQGHFSLHSSNSCGGTINEGSIILLSLWSALTT